MGFGGMRERCYFGAVFIWAAFFLIHWGVWTARTLGRGWPTGLAFLVAVVGTAIVAALLLRSAARAGRQSGT